MSDTPDSSAVRVLQRKGVPGNAPISPLAAVCTGASLALGVLSVPYFMMTLEQSWNNAVSGGTVDPNRS